MSFLYPRTVSISRPQGQTGIGNVGYSGVEKGTEILIASGIPASVQAKTTMARVPNGSLPAEPPGPIVWRVYIPNGKVADGVIQDRDIITDDLGRRFQVEADYVNSMGWNLPCVRLEAR